MVTLPESLKELGDCKCDEKIVSSVESIIYMVGLNVGDYPRVRSNNSGVELLWGFGEKYCSIKLSESSKGDVVNIETNMRIGDLMVSSQETNFRLSDDEKRQRWARSFREGFYSVTRSRND
jgi:hypothetical protein